MQDSRWWVPELFVFYSTSTTTFPRRTIPLAIQLAKDAMLGGPPYAVAAT